MTPRTCDWCDTQLPAGAKPDKHTCTDRCRITLSKWRRGIGPFHPDGPGVDDQGRGKPANQTVAAEHRDRDRMRARRALGPIPSDLRLQRSAAIEAGVAAMRHYGPINLQDATAIVTAEVDRRLPGGARV